MPETTYAQAAMDAVSEEMRRDKKVLYMSTDVVPLMQKEFGADRVKTTPISETGFVGAAVGLAGAGFRPIINVRMATFMFVAMDQFVNQAAKITYMFGGQARFPIVYRFSVGAGTSMAAQHCISPYSMFMNTPGLKIVLPSTPYDMKGLLKTAIRDNNPVMVFEHTLLGPVVEEVPLEDYVVPLGQAAVRRQGKDVTVVGLAKMNHEALAVAEDLSNRGVSVEVIDPRTLVPLDKATILASVRKTGRLVVVDEACQTCSAASEIVTLVAEDPQTFKSLKAHPRRVCAPDVPIPYSPPMEQYVVPNQERIKAAVLEVLK